MSWVAAGLLVLAFLRILFLFLVPFDLSGDEAYYWEWGQHLDLGYFSKPPGIGWLMGFADWLGLHSAPAIRSVAVVLGTLTAWFLFRLGERMYGLEAGLLGLLMFLMTPANGALNAILTIDAPLMTCWSAALYCFWRFRERKCESVAWALGLMVALIGGLLAKQMMLVFYPLAIASLALQSNERALLKRPLLWLSFAGSLSALAPMLIWNRSHGWATVEHTMHHFEGAFSVQMTLGRLVEFVLAQAAVTTPLLWALLVFALWRAGSSWGGLGQRERFLLLFSAPGLITIAAMTVRQRINANWPAVFYASAVVLLAGWMGQSWDAPSRRFPRLFRAALGLAATLTAASYLACGLLALGWLPAKHIDLVSRVKGWSDLSREVQETRQSLGANAGIVITQSHRFVTSELAFYLPDRPRVYRYPQSSGIESQHDFWPGPPTQNSVNALIVVEGSRNDLAPQLAQKFEQMTFLKEYSQGPSGPRYAFFQGRNLRDWPKKL